MSLFIKELNELKKYQKAGGVFNVCSNHPIYSNIETNDIYVSTFLLEHKKLSKQVQEFYKKYPEVYKE